MWQGEVVRAARPTVPVLALGNMVEGRQAPDGGRGVSHHVSHHAIAAPVGGEKAGLQHIAVQQVM